VGPHLLQGVISGYVVWKQRKFDKKILSSYTLVGVNFIFLKSTGKVGFLSIFFMPAFFVVF